VKGGPAFWCSSDLGITRRNNEDACLTASIHFSTSNITTLYRILCAADGAGEHGYGEVASKEAILEAFNKLVYAILWRETDITDLLWKAISSANKRIMEIKSEMRSDMATTLTIVLIKDSDIHIGHVGDSRAYLVNTRTREIRQLTRDHKYVEDLVEQGLISKEEAKFHPQRNIITSALGMENPRIDILRFNDVFKEGSRILVCSDGLSDLVNDSKIALQAVRSTSPAEIIQSLIRLANERGGLDNISVAIDGYVF
jgi:protein phosphatase